MELDLFAFDVLNKNFIRVHLFDLTRALFVCKGWHDFLGNPKFDDFWRRYFYANLGDPRNKENKQTRPGTWRKKVTILTSLLRMGRDQSKLKVVIHRCISQKLVQILDEVLEFHAWKNQLDYSLNDLAQNLGAPLHCAIMSESFTLTSVCIKHGFSRKFEFGMPGKKTRSSLDLVRGKASVEMMCLISPEYIKQNPSVLVDKIERFQGNKKLSHEMIQLIDAGVPVNHIGPRQGHGALHLACLYGLLNVARHLLSNGADPFLLARSKTPIQFAMRTLEEGLINMLKLLISYGASVYGIAGGNRTFLIYEATARLISPGRHTQKEKEVIYFLWRQMMGAHEGEAPDVNQISDYDTGNTLLHLICQNYPKNLNSTEQNVEKENDEMEVIQFLVSEGVDINARNKEGLTPFDMLFKYRFSRRKADYFIKLGVNPESAFRVCHYSSKEALEYFMVDLKLNLPPEFILNILDWSDLLSSPQTHIDERLERIDYVEQFLASNSNLHHFKMDYTYQDESGRTILTILVRNHPNWRGRGRNYYYNYNSNSNFDNPSFNSRIMPFVNKFLNNGGNVESYEKNSDSDEIEMAYSALERAYMNGNLFMINLLEAPPFNAKVHPGFYCLKVKSGRDLGPVNDSVPLYYLRRLLESGCNICDKCVTYVAEEFDIERLMLLNCYFTKNNLTWDTLINPNVNKSGEEGEYNNENHNENDESESDESERQTLYEKCLSSINRKIKSRESELQYQKDYYCLLRAQRKRENDNNDNENWREMIDDVDDFSVGPYYENILKQGIEAKTIFLKAKEDPLYCFSYVKENSSLYESVID